MHAHFRVQDARYYFTRAIRVMKKTIFRVGSQRVIDNERAAHERAN